MSLIFFFFNDTATTEIYTLSLHDALPICVSEISNQFTFNGIYDNDMGVAQPSFRPSVETIQERSEEHTSELQSPDHLVCRLLLEKKKKTHTTKGHPRDCPLR